MKTNKRGKFAFSKEEEKDGNSLSESLEGFKSLIRSPAESTLSYALKLAEVPDNEEIAEDCYLKAREVLSSGAVDGLGLTEDDAAIIASFTYEGDSTLEAPFSILNRTILKRNIKGIKSIMPYMLMLMKALRKLERYENKEHLYRGIDRTMEYTVGEKKKWWGFTSTTVNREVVTSFLRGARSDSDEAVVAVTGTIFVISKGWGYDIRPFSFFQEGEILLDIERTVRITDVVVGEFQEVHVDIVETDLIFNDALIDYPSCAQTPLTYQYPHYSPDGYYYQPLGPSGPPPPGFPPGALPPPPSQSSWDPSQPALPYGCPPQQGAPPPPPPGPPPPQSSWDPSQPALPYGSPLSQELLHQDHHLAHGECRQGHHIIRRNHRDRLAHGVLHQDHPDHHHIITQEKSTRLAHGECRRDHHIIRRVRLVHGVLHQDHPGHHHIITQEKSTRLVHGECHRDHHIIRRDRLDRRDHGDIHQVRHHLANGIRSSSRAITSSLYHQDVILILLIAKSNTLERSSLTATHQNQNNKKK